MRGIRVQPGKKPGELLIDVTCDCKRSSLAREDTGENSFDHSVELRADAPSFVLECCCGNRYRVRPQEGHVHIDNLR